MIDEERLLIVEVKIRPGCACDLRASPNFNIQKSSFVNQSWRSRTHRSSASAKSLRIRSGTKEASVASSAANRIWWRKIFRETGGT